jgi:hypothetical protein
MDTEAASLAAHTPYDVLGGTYTHAHRPHCVLTRYTIGSCSFIFEMIDQTFMDAHAIISGVAQWLACWAHNPKVRGSKPRSATFFGLREHPDCQIHFAAQQRRFDWIKFDES